MKNRKLSKNEEEVDNAPFTWKSKVFKEELKTNVTMAFPVVISNLMQYLLNVETLSFCGRLTSTEMESTGLALSILTAFGWYVCSGMVTACDTMFAQAFGSNEKKRTGLFLQRGVLMLNLIPFLLLAVYFNMEPILLLLGQNPEISRLTQDFLIAFSPGIIFIMNYILFARYMQDQGCLWPPVVAGVIGNIFNIFFQFLFVVYLDYGFRAAAICHALSYGVMLICELIYIIKTKFYQATWPGFQKEAFCDWLHMFKLGIAGVAHLTFEAILCETNVLLGGIIGTLELATQSIFLQLLNVLFVIYYGAGITCNIRVGQCLGANKPNQAKAAYRAGIVSIGIGTVILATLVMSLSHQIPYIFTDKKDVVNMVVDIFPYIYLILFIDPFSAVYNASLRGCGRQATGCLVIFLAYYVIALPSSIVLAFVFNFGIKGLWIGTTIGSLITMTSITSILECQNWKKQAQLAQQRIIYSSNYNENNSSNTEDEALLAPLLIEDKSTCDSTKHIRTPSYPIFCSTDIVKLPKPKVVVNVSMIYKKMLLVISAILFFGCGIIVHIFLPIELYRQANSSSILN